MTSNTQGDSIDSALQGWVNEALLMGDAGLCRPEELPSCKHTMTLSGFLEFQLYESKVSPHLKYFHEQRNLNACQDLSACCFGAYKRCNIHSAFSCGRVETFVYILPCEGCITQLGQPHCELVIIGFALLKHHNEEVEWWTLTALHYVVCYDGEVSSQSCFLTCLNSWGFHCWL